LARIQNDLGGWQPQATFQWSAPKWPHLASMWTAPDDRPVPVTNDHLGQLGGAVAEVGPGLFQGSDEAGAGRLDGSH
jgi:hypothetical protein